MKLRLPLELKAAVLAAFSFVSFTNSSVGANAFSINFGDDIPKSGGTITEEDLLGVEAVKIKNWYNTGDLANSSGAIDIVNKIKAETGFSVKWGSNNTYQGGPNGDNAVEQLLFGYLDDGNAGDRANGNRVVVSGIDYLKYDVYVYAGGDAAPANSTGETPNPNARNFRAKIVNGVSYTYNETTNQTVTGTGNWGLTQKSVLKEGDNYLKVAGLAGITLTVEGGTNGNSARGGISGLQIVDTYAGTYYDAALADNATVDWQAKGANSPWSVDGAKTDWVDSTGDINATTGSVASIAVTGSATLNIGTSVAVDSIRLKSGNLTLSGGTLNLINYGLISLSPNAVLTLDTTLSSNLPLNVVGFGELVFKKKQTLQGLNGVANVTVADGSGLTINSSNNSTFEGKLKAGSSLTLIKQGTGIFNLLGDTTEALASWDIQGGGFYTLSDFQGNVNISSEFAYYEIDYSSTTGNYTFDVANVSGVGELRLKGSGNGSDANIATFEGIVLNDSFTGAIGMSGGQFVLDQAFLDTSKKHDMILRGATLTLSNVPSLLDLNGLTILGASGTLKVVSSGVDVTYTGLNLEKASGTNGLTLNVDRKDANDDHLTTFENITGSINALNMGEATDVKITGSKTNLTIAGRLYLSKETSKLTIEDGILTIGDQLIISGGGGNWGTIVQTGGTLNAKSIRMADWNNSTTQFSEYQMSGGVLNVNDDFESGKDGRGRLILSGGVANLNGYLLNTGSYSEDGGRGAELHVTGGVLNIGSRGINYGGTQDTGHLTKKIYFSGGTIGALENWNTVAKLTLQSAAGVAGNVTVDTTKANTSSVASTITWSGVVEGAGALTLKGAGTLVLSGANTFTGGVTLTGGTLSLGNANSLGANDSRNLTVTGNANIITAGVTGKTVDKLTMSGSGLLNLGGAGANGSLNIGTLSGNSAFVMDLFADGTSDHLTLGTLENGSSITMEFLLTSGSIGKTYTLVNGFTDASKIDFKGYRDTLTFAEGVDGGNYTVTVGGIITSETVTWKGTTASGTWKLGDAASWNDASGGYYQADNVVFAVPTAVAGAGNFHTVNLEGVLAPNSVTVTTAADKNYLFADKGILSGGMSLIKDGEGTLLIQTTGTQNNYSGATNINAGTLEFAAGTYAGTSLMTVASGATLKVHNLLSNNITVNGNYTLSFGGTTTNDLGAMANVTWGASSHLVLEQGAYKGGKGMLKEGVTVNVTSGSAFDLSGVERNNGNDKYHFNLELAGQGVLVGGVYTGALFNSGGILYGFSGIGNVTVKEDAMVKVGGGNSSGNYSDGLRYDIDGILDLNGKILTKMGYGGVYGKSNSLATTNSGTLKIAEGFFCVESTDFGSSGSATKANIEVFSKAGIAMFTNNTVYANVLLNSENTDLTKEYVARNYANIFTNASNDGNTANYAGGVTLNKGAAIMLGWGISNKGSNVALSGQLSGTGILYVDGSGSPYGDDSDTGASRIRHLYLGAEVSGIDGIQMIGKSVLQLSTVNAGAHVALKNAVIGSGGLKITGGRDSIVKIATTGTAATFTGLNFGITEGLYTGMELRVIRESSNSSQLTTLNDTTGTLQSINLKVGSKLAMSGATNLTVNDNLALEGEIAEFVLNGGLLDIKKNVTVAGTSKLNINGAGVIMTAGGSLNLNGVGAELLAQNGQLKITGDLNMSGGSLLNLSGDNTLVEISGKMVVSGQNAHLKVSSGTLNILGEGESLLGDGANDNRGIFDQTGGTVNVGKFLLSAYPTPNNAGSEYNLTGGTLNVTEHLQVGNDGGASFSISGGVANIEKLMIGKWTGSTNRMEIHLRDNGRLNIGAGGIVRNNGTILDTRVINFSGGILGAMKNWSTEAELTLLKISDAAVGVTVDTTLTGGGAGTITWKGTVNGAGKLNVDGSGVLELAGTNNFTGDVTIKGNSTLRQNASNALSAKVIITGSGTLRMGGDNKAVGDVDVQSGQLLLDKAGATTGAVTLSGGTVNVQANATMASLLATGGTVNVSSGTLTMTGNSIVLGNSATIHFTQTGNLNAGAQVTLNGVNTVAEIAKGEDNEFASVLLGNGTFKINNTASAVTTYKGASASYTGMVDVVGGELLLEASASMGQATAQVNAGQQLSFAGTAEQVATVIGAGRVSFTNPNVNITKASLFTGFTGNLFIGTDQKVMFTGTGASSTPLLGEDMSVEFGGNSTGILLLNNTHETLHDIVLTSSGTIQLRGSDVVAVLDGSSWLGDGTEQSKLTLDVGANKVYVTDKTLSDTELDRLIMITDQGRGGVVLDTNSGLLRLDQAIELTASFVNDPAQSYQITANHSLTQNRHTLTGDTLVRSLTIVASATNSELLMQPGVKLGLKLGRLTISNNPGESAPYTITGGRIGMLAAIDPTNTTASQLSIYQDAAGLVTISSTVDDTVFLLSKKGTGDLLLSGTLQNKGGILVEGGSLTLTGTSVNSSGTILGNKAELNLGDGKKAYQVNYAGLNGAAGSTTTFSALSVLNRNFVVNNAGSVNLLMGTSVRFDHAFTGAGTTVIGNGTDVILPQGAVQDFTVQKEASLTMELSSAASSGKVMRGEGDVILKNTSGAALDLSGVETGTAWSGFTGKLTMSSDQAMTLNLGLMGTGASLVVSKDGRVNDIGSGTSARDYNVTLGDNATWSLANGVTYKGTLALGTVGTLIQTAAVINSDITGGVLNVQGGHLTLGGNSSHQITNVGANTTVTGTSAGAFGGSLQVNAQGALVQVDGNVVTGALTVAEGAGLELKSGSLTINGATDFNGELSGSGDLNLGDNSTLGGTVSGNLAGATVSITKGELILSSDLGLADVNVGAGARLTITGNTGLSDNTITLGAGSTMTGGSDFNGILNIVGNGTSAPLSATVNGGLNVQSLHMIDPTAGLEVNGNMNVQNGGSFLLSDANTQGALGGAIVKATGSINLSGIFAVDLNVNESFTHNEETITFQLFKGEGGLNVNLPDEEHVSLAIDETIREFFTLDQSTFTSNGIISIKRQEMVCILLDPSNIAPGGSHENGYKAGNSNSYLGANSNNNGILHPDVFFYDKSYTIAESDNAYRLTSGEAWMNFHVTMTDQQLDAPTKLVVRRMEKAGVTPTNAGGVILSIRGNADNTYSGGTQIYQAKVKVDGTLNATGTGTVSDGDVYFFGTGRVEATGNEAAIILNTGGDGSNGTYTFNNDFLLQQGALLDQTSSSNILMGDLTVKDMATIRNSSDNDLILSGSKLNGNKLQIQGVAGVNGSVTLEGVTGEKVTAKFTTVDINNSGRLSVGRNATTNIGSMYLDKGSSVTMTEGGVFAVKEMKNGSNGAGDVYLSGGTFKLLGDMAITENGAKYHVTSNSTYDTNGYYLEVNQYMTDWSDFTVTGGGTMIILKDLSSFDSHATITGDKTTVSISKDKTLAGIWTVKDGGILQTQENVTIRGQLNIGKGGSTDFGLGTKMDNALIKFGDGSNYAGFLQGIGASITFETGSHFQIKTEDLRKLTDSGTESMLIASNIIIEDGKGFFNFSGGDGIINDAIIDSGKEKTLIIGTEGINVGGLDNFRSVTGTSVLELTEAQLAQMVGETNYRWLSFALSADEYGDEGAKMNLTVTRNVNFAELAETSNEVAIAPVLSYIGMEGGKVDSHLQGKELNDLGLALTKATGDAYQMLSNISLSTSSIMAGYSVQRENLRRHTLELRDRAIQERPCALRNQYETLENTVWASGQGGTYSVDGDNNAVGHTTSLWGGQLGVSRCVNDNLVLGLAFTYTSSDINLDQGMGKATSDAYYIDLYAKYHKDNWNVTGILTGGFTDLETERNMSIEGFSSRTKGSSSGNQLMGMVEVGYEFDLEGDRSNIIEPFAALTAGYSSIDGFDETGAGTAGLNVASQSDTSCSIGAGVRYVKEFSTSTDELLRGRFEVRAMILQDLTDNEVDVEARFIGANGHSFPQKSTEIGKTGFLLGTGVVLPTSTNMSFFADLNGEFRSSETGCNANIGVKYNF